MSKFKIQKSATVNVGFDSTGVVGGTGGLTSIAGNQVLAQVYLTGGSAGAGSILRGKGKNKFLVTDGTRTGICSLVNKAVGALVAGEMSITATPAVGGTFRVAKLTNKFMVDFSGNKYIWKFGAASGSIVSIPNA